MTNVVFFLYAAMAESLTGTWTVKGEIAGNSVSPVCKLVQTGTALSGECTSIEIHSKLTGDVNQSQVTWHYSVAYEGQTYTLMYSGKLLKSGQIEGNIDVKEAGTSVTFTARKD